MIMHLSFDSDSSSMNLVNFLILTSSVVSPLTFFKKAPCPNATLLISMISDPLSFLATSSAAECFPTPGVPVMISLYRLQIFTPHPNYRNLVPTVICYLSYSVNDTFFGAIYLDYNYTIVT